MTSTQRLRRGATAIALGLALGTGMALDGAGRPAAAQLPNLDEIMRNKLQHGQDLMEAVVLGQHTAVERHAYELTLLSEASTWTALRTPQYLEQAAGFRDSATRLMEAAQQQDMDRVAAAYTELVTTCVQCHRHVRGAARAD